MLTEVIQENRIGACYHTILKIVHHHPHNCLNTNSNTRDLRPLLIVARWDESNSAWDSHVKFDFENAYQYEGRKPELCSTANDLIYTSGFY